MHTMRQRAGHAGRHCANCWYTTEAPIHETTNRAGEIDNRTWAHSQEKLQIGRIGKYWSMVPKRSVVACTRSPVSAGWNLGLRMFRLSPFGPAGDPHADIDHAAE